MEEPGPRSPEEDLADQKLRSEKVGQRPEVPR